MIRVEIRNKTSEQLTNLGHFETNEEVIAWIELCERDKAWGTPEHDVLVSEAVLEIVDQETGEILVHAQDAVYETVPADYTIEIIPDWVDQNKINIEALAYLAETDWYVLREMDTGEPCPPEIKAERQAARARVVR